MKAFYTSLVFLTIVLLNTEFIYPQWVQTNGPVGGFVNCLAENGQNLYAGTYPGGFFISTDNGINWKQANEGNTLPEVISIAVSGINIYAGTYDGVYLSTNEGIIWTKIGMSGHNIYSLALNGTSIFAGTQGEGVFCSTNNGSSWNQKNNGLGDTYIHALIINGSNILAGTINSGVYLSSNNGTNWIHVNNGMPNTWIHSFALMGNNIFASSGNLGVFYSQDNGSNWTTVNNGLSNLYVLSLAVSGKDVFAGTYGDGVFHSTDNGANWSKVNNGLIDSIIYFLVVSGTNIFSVTGQGVFISTNDGSIWTQVGPPSTVTYSLAMNGPNIFAGTQTSGVFFYPDNGTNWNHVNNGLINVGEVFALIVLGTNVFAGTNAGVYLSTNNGLNWTPVNNGMTSNKILCLATSENNIFAGTGGQHGTVLLSTNNGTNWIPANNGINSNNILSLAVNGNDIYAGTGGSGIFQSTNNGTNWTTVNNGIPSIGITSVWSLAVRDKYIFAGTNNGMFYSTNNGTNWTQDNNGLISDSVYSLCINGTNIFAGSSGGIYLSIDNGTNWILVNDGLVPSPIYSLACNGTDIYAGTMGAGVWRRALSDLGLPVELTLFTASAGRGSILLKWNTATELNNMGFDVERSTNKTEWGKVGFVKGNGNSTAAISYSYVDNSVSKAGKYYYRLKQVDNNGSFKYSSVAEVEFGAPGSYALNQNYPNPFNPNTTIAYRLKERGFVKLKVYGIKGELVKVLVNEQKDAGYYESEFEGRGLASGVYIYRLEIIGEGNKVFYSDMKKTVLLK